MRPRHFSRMCKRQFTVLCHPAVSLKLTIETESLRRAYSLIRHMARTNSSVLGCSGDDSETAEVTSIRVQQVTDYAYFQSVTRANGLAVVLPLSRCPYGARSFRNDR